MKIETLKAHERGLLIQAVIRHVYAGSPERPIQSLEKGFWYLDGMLFVDAREDFFATNRLPDFSDQEAPELKKLIWIFPEKDHATGDINSEFICRFKTGASKPSIESLDLSQIQTRISHAPALALRYEPDCIPDGASRLQALERLRAAYDQALVDLYGKIQFIGMSVYKEEAAAGIAMESIYIPLRLIPEGAAKGDEANRVDPLRLTAPGRRHVILGEPGSGKSTLLRFLAMAGFHPPLIEAFGSQPDQRLPLLIVLRQFADELKGRPELTLLNYLIETARGYYNLPEVDALFLEYYLEAGQAILFFDGVDELPDPAFKIRVRDRIAAFLGRYPGNTAIISSRIVGYEKEARFDALGFEHHQVARLTLNEIDGFVRNWYRARVDNRQECKRHADDLLRIVHDQQAVSIRGLAENPLLLTIICLVHRIDAVLPDERVVLYQKCTETLLNTWHAWKFKIERQGSRNKVERRNRARMEAIAYWMHAAMGKQEKNRRAVVPYQDLLEYLIEYIEDFEKPKFEIPRELAETFLKFVRERAGLLIEAGDRQYSFVHLTFQEYLTATHLRKSGETGGVGVVWEAVQDKVGSSRWHEVLRLLIGSLERAESQGFMLERIRSERDPEQAAARALLLGGCLLDGVDGAEELEEEIAAEWLSAATDCFSEQDYAELLGQMRVWIQKAEQAHDLFINTVKRLMERNRFKPELAITLALLDIPVERIEILGQIDWSSEIEGVLWRNCTRLDQPLWPLPLTDKQRALVETTSTYLALSGRGANLLVAVLNALMFVENDELHIPDSLLSLTLWPYWAARPYANMILNSSILGTKHTGYGHRNEELLVRDLIHGWRKDRVLGRDRVRIRVLSQVRVLDRVRIRSRVLVRERGLIRDRVLDRVWDRVLDRVRDRVRVWDRDRDRIRVLDRVLSDAINAFNPSAPTISDVITRHSEALKQPAHQLAISQSLCTLLDLETKPQWVRLTAERLVPRAGENIDLFSSEHIRQTLQTFIQGRPTRAQCRRAASLLLIDAWLWVTEVYKTPADSRFKAFAEAPFFDVPELHIAQLLWAASYGDESKADELTAIIKHPAPPYRDILTRAYWIDDENEKTGRLEI